VRTTYTHQRQRNRELPRGDTFDANPFDAAQIEAINARPRKAPTTQFVKTLYKMLDRIHKTLDNIKKTLDNAQ